jgi:ArsR family transcriptional regulator
VLGQRQAFISQHLMALRRAGWVTRRKQGLRVYYRASQPGILALLDSAQIVAGCPQQTPARTVRRTSVAPRTRCRCPQCTPPSPIQAAA